MNLSLPTLLSLPVLVLLLGLAVLQLYLFLSQRTIHFHYQNQGSELRPEPTWRNGRAWFTFYPLDENRHDRYPSPTFHPWWRLFRKEGLAFKFYMAEDDADFSFFFEFLFGQFGFSLEGWPIFYKLFKKVYRMGMGYGTGI